MMTDFPTWESWPGYTDETKSRLEFIASHIYDDCQGWADINDDNGLPIGDRILIKGTMSRPTDFPLAHELLEEVVDRSQRPLLK